jgi:uncharacterized damage-inducible protein DinB
MLPHLSAVVLRDLDALRIQVEAYPADDLLWQAIPGLPNSGGTLALHLCGNLQHYIGAVLGASGYVRDRDAEFSRRDVPRAEFLRLIATTRQAVERALRGLDEARLAEDYPETVGGLRIRTGEFLVHLASHLGYHLGQIDAHRRLATRANRSAGAPSLAALPSARKVS